MATSPEILIEETPVLDHSSSVNSSLSKTNSLTHLKKRKLLQRTDSSDFLKQNPLVKHIVTINGIDYFECAYSGIRSEVQFVYKNLPFYSANCAASYYIKQTQNNKLRKPQKINKHFQEIARSHGLSTVVLENLEGKSIDEDREVYERHRNPLLSCYQKACDIMKQEKERKKILGTNGHENKRMKQESLHVYILYPGNDTASHYTVPKDKEKIVDPYGMEVSSKEEFDELEDNGIVGASLIEIDKKKAKSVLVLDTDKKSTKEYNAAASKILGKDMKGTVMFVSSSPIPIIRTEIDNELEKVIKNDTTQEPPLKKPGFFGARKRTPEEQKKLHEKQFYDKYKDISNLVDMKKLYQESKRKQKKKQ
jgi:hypothetical protein